MSLSFKKGELGYQRIFSQIRYPCASIFYKSWTSFNKDNFVFVFFLKREISSLTSKYIVSFIALIAYGECEYIVDKNLFHE